MIGPGSRSILLDRAIIKESNRVPCLWLLWGCPSAVLLGVQTPVLLSSYWLATVLVYSAELEEAHVDQTGCRPLSLLLYFLVHHIAPSLVLFLLNPMWVFSSGQLTIWGVGWPLASPPAAKPSILTKAKLPFLPDETLDFLNTSDARHLIFLFDALLVCTAYYAASKTGALLGSTEEGGLKMILNTWRLVLLWGIISQSPCHLQRSDAAPSSQMPGWSPHHRPPCFSHWPGSAQEVGLDCGPEVFLISLLQVWVQIFIQAAIPCSERWISAILRIFWWEIWICPRNMRAFPPQICLVFLSSWEMFVFQGMLSLLKKASELLQVLEVRREWFGVKKQQTLTGNRVTLTDIL